MSKKGTMKKKKQQKDWTWWKHGVIYQVYPRSFYDSDDDGVGDLKGITIKLGYLAELGVDALLLNSIFASPMYDFGYDISDYTGIEPSYGTFDDFKELVRQAHRHDIRIIVDISLNHTSHEHPWFVESRSSKNNPKHDWYIWHDGNGKKPPTNWKSEFGGSAWEWDDTRKQFYYHSFLKEQPDLNWRNKSVRKEIYKILQFWQDQGVDGFRLDSVNLFFKDKEFRNNNFSLKRTSGLQNRQQDLFNKNRPEVHDALRKVRELVDVFEESVLLGEIHSDRPGNPLLSAGYLVENELHLAMDFSLLYAKWGARQFYECINRLFSLIPEKAWPCNFLSNHDFSRILSRVKGNMYKAKIAAAFLLTIKGTPIIYYGEEIGMSDVSVKKTDALDHLGKTYWPRIKGRDPMRTPMQWNEDIYAGFSHAKPWLPVNKDYKTVNADAQSYDSESLLDLYKELIALRKEKAPLHQGDMFPLLDGSNGVLAFYRIHEFEKILVVLNFSNNYRSFDYSDSEKWKVLFSTEKIIGKEFPSLRFDVAPYEITILESVGMLNFQVEFV